MTAPTKTPRTDALHKNLVRMSEGPGWIKGKDYCVMRDHAGELEVLLAAARAEADELARRVALNVGDTALHRGVLGSRGRVTGIEIESVIARVRAEMEKERTG